MTDPTIPDDTPTDEYAWWCPVCKKNHELPAATKPLPKRYPDWPANQCSACDSTLVLKKKGRAG